jgi:O-antigen/teichoic acid export membrane protein
MPNFLKNVLKLVSGSVIAQALGILLIPVITRLYSPDDFGILQIFTSISSIIAIIACFSYQLSIMLPDKDEDSANIVALCVILIIITSTIAGIISFIFANQIAEYLNTPLLSNYLILIPFAVFVNGIFIIMNYWLSRKIRFGVIAGARVSNTVSNKFVQIGGTMGDASPFGLILGTIIGYTVANILMFRSMTKDLIYFKRISMNTMKKLAIRYKKFPMYTSWSIAANTISIQIPSFMLAFFYSTTVVGHYALANQAVNLPMGLVGSAIGQVFFQKVSEEKNRTGDVKSIVVKVYKKLISIGVFPMLVLMILGEELFSFIFGPDWVVSGTYVRILIPWMFLVFIASPLSTLYSVFEKQEVGLGFNISLLLSRIGALYIGAMYGGPIFALVFFSFTGVIFWGWNNYYLLKIADVGLRESISIAVKYIIIASVISIPIIFGKFFLLNMYVLFLIAGITTLIYYLVVIYDDQLLRNEIFRLFESVKK